MSKHITVTIGEAEYSVKVNRARGKRFRAGFAEKVEPFVALVGASADIEISNSADLAALVQNMGPRLLNIVDDLVELVMLYAPHWDWDAIEDDEETTDEQLLEAFVQIMGAVYPANFLMARLSRGGKASGMLKNLTSANGTAEEPALAS